MTQSLKELLAQREQLEKTIELARQAHLSEAINKAKEIVQEFQLTREDVFGPMIKVKTGAKRGPVKGQYKVVAKYRDPLTGNAWSGRGLIPSWLRGKDLNDYLIEPVTV